MIDTASPEKSDVALGFVTVPEVPEPIALPVTGTLPPYLGTSTLYRIGPGCYDATHADGKPYVISHWFDGLTLLHAFRVDAGANSVRYHSRLHGESLRRAAASVPRAQWPAFSFGSPDPCRSLLGKLMQLWTAAPFVPDPATGRRPVPNVGVTVQTIPGKGLVARTDSVDTVQFDERSLEVAHFFRLSKEYGVRGVMSASHGYYDADTDEYFNYAYQLSAAGPVEYSVFAVGPTGRSRVLAKLSHDPCYLHSFAVSRNYVVLIFWPVHISGAWTMLSRSVLAGMQFRADAPTRFAVVARDGRGLVADYDAEPFFAFHTVNAFEDPDDDALVVDVSRYGNADVLHMLKLDALRSGDAVAPTTLSRYRLPRLSAEIAAHAGDTSAAARPRPKAVHSVLDPHCMELARVSAHVLRAPHRFVYGVSQEGERDLFSRIAKVDVTDGSRVTWGQGLRVLVGEPIFVRDPDGTEEDDGCLLVVALDVERKASRMVVLDAKDLSEMASAEVPQVVPFGFHGAHRPS